MALVWDIEGLKAFDQRPMLVQEYYNHRATVIKTYVCGAKFWKIPIPSLPDFHSASKPIYFNSQDFKKELPPELTVDYAGSLTVPDDDIVQVITERLSECLGLEIFGYDLIQNVDTGEWAVIDVNYFPDFRGAEGFHQALCDLVIQKLERE